MDRCDNYRSPALGDGLQVVGPLVITRKSQPLDTCADSFVGKVTPLISQETHLVRATCSSACFRGLMSSTYDFLGGKVCHRGLNSVSV
jgi:hypothetical protein